MLQNQLVTLESSGLIRLATIEPDLEYLFRHALIQEAAYTSLLKSDRSVLHLRVGETLERLYTEQLDEVAPVLAYHFAEAGDETRALHYYLTAGDNAFRVYANTEAVMHYAHALAIASRSPALCPPATRQHLYTRRGRALELLGHYAAALRNYEEMEKIALTLGDRSLQLAALILKATVHSAPTALYDTEQGRALSEQALALAHELDDRSAEAKALWNLMLVHKFCGEMEPALEFGERALCLARASGPREPLAYILNDISFLYRLIHQHDRADEVLLEALALWRELGIQNMQADCLTSLAGLRALSGRYDEALALANEAGQISQLIGNLWNQSYSLFEIVNIYIDRGEFGSAIAAAETCIRLGEEAGFGPAQVETRAELAFAYARLGDIESGLATAQLALEKARALFPAWQALPISIQAYLRLMAGDDAAAGSLIQEARDLSPMGDAPSPITLFVGLIMGELAVAHGNYALVLKMAEDAIATLNSLDIRMYYGDVLYLKSAALLGLGRIDEGYQALEIARDFAEQIKARYALWQIYAALSALERERGNETAAQHWQTQAQETIHTIANNAGSAKHHDSFLALPRVRAISNPQTNPALARGRH